MPQEASALKSGSLPTSGWVIGAFKAYWQGEIFCEYNSPTLITTNKAFADKCWASDIAITLKSSTVSFDNAYSSNANTWAYDSLTTFNDETARVYKYYGEKIYVTQTGKIYGKGYSSASSFNYLYVVKLGFADETEYNYTISDTSITVNSDILMELTDDGGVRALSIAAGKITVVRDSIPTNNIPYTYKVKQTNASGQFTLVNHFVPTKTSEPTNDSGFITVGEWQNWSDTSVLTEEGLYEIVTTEYPSDGNKTLFVQYEQGKPNNGACWVSVATANSISVVTPICSGDGTLRVERRLANSSDPADLLTFKYRKIN